MLCSLLLSLLFGLFVGADDLYFHYTRIQNAIAAIDMTGMLADDVQACAREAFKTQAVGFSTTLGQKGANGQIHCNFVIQAKGFEARRDNQSAFYLLDLRSNKEQCEKHTENVYELLQEASRCPAERNDCRELADLKERCESTDVEVDEHSCTPKSPERVLPPRVPGGFQYTKSFGKDIGVFKLNDKGDKTEKGILKQCQQHGNSWPITIENERQNDDLVGLINEKEGAIISYRITKQQGRKRRGLLVSRANSWPPSVNAYRSVSELASLSNTDRQEETLVAVINWPGNKGDWVKVSAERAYTPYVGNIACMMDPERLGL
ncbi:hypothetical protein QR680_005060 [Steinernema hermaphroditum]|uniref:Uncharacterized protein n=1 Tax=Steinernema hermaphroditum TaxID=289476 RepID=A0AA39LU75_9BILA|nr:hypothetical protein QR680_005060 [Steinernema hermaphroditum]